MLSKSQIKACLSGEPTPSIPAYLLWFDRKFEEKNADRVRELRKVYRDDFIQCSTTLEKRMEDPILEPGEYTDEWGCLFKAAPDGVGAHPTRPRISTVAEWEEYVEQGIPLLDTNLSFREAANAAALHPDRYVVVQFWRTFYERMYMLIGFENLLIEIADNGELFRRMLSGLKDFTIRGIEMIADAGADAVFLADDWGTQHRLQISPTMWKQHFRPAYAAAIETAHSLGLDVWLHSCGNIAEIIPDWIDIHLDVIGHLQAAALDLPSIAENYQGKITFLGGIDVQFNLVNGTRESIHDEVQSLYRMFCAHDGRYIASPSNSIMPETPVGNVEWLFEAIRDFGSDRA